jgi:hypothetical protein
MNPSTTIVKGIVCNICKNELPPMTMKQHLDGDFNQECPHTPVSIYDLANEKLRLWTESASKNKKAILLIDNKMKRHPDYKKYIKEKQNKTVSTMATNFCKAMTK